jgi:hypothetical protein
VVAVAILTAVDRDDERERAANLLSGTAAAGRRSVIARAVSSFFMWRLWRMIAVRTDLRQGDSRPPGQLGTRL